MTCKECNQRNPIGNKFCRECGAKIVLPEGSLAAEEAARAESERKSERGAILLSDAHFLAGQGKLVAAVPVAEEAVATLPFSVSALTLLVTLYEHTDQREKAIVVQERIVDLIPNAEKEATRLERMKRGERTSPPPNVPVSAGLVPTLRGASESTVPLTLPRWFPAAASVVGAGFAVYLGFLALSPGKSSADFTPSQTVPVAMIAPAPQTAEIPMNPGAMPPPVLDPNRGGDPFVSLDETRRQLQQQQNGAPNPRATPPANITAGAPLPLPKPLPGARNVAPKPGPVVIPSDIIKVSKLTGEEAPLPPIVAAPPATGNGNDGFGGERIAATPPPSTTAVGTGKWPGSYMRIEVNSRASSPPIAVSAPPSSAPDMDSDPMRRARTLQGMGRYKEAIESYQEAISAGASAGEAQQSIALCHQRAGDAASAKVAYIQAIAAYKAQIASGRNPSAATRGVNTCEAALGTL